jgi:hypothetical protein
MDPVEERLRDRLVAAFGHPRALEIAAAKVHSERHARRSCGDRIIDEPRIALGELVRVLTARRHVLARVRVAVARQRRVVELQIGAAGGRQLGNLLPVDAC